MRRVLAAMALLALVGTVPAFAQTDDAQPALPKSLAGLVVKKENIGKPGPRSARDLLVDVRLVSLRRGKQLEATLQLGRFRDSAPTGDLAFRRSIASRVGTVVPVEHRVGTRTLYVTKGKRLAVVAWFDDRSLYVLSIRETYTSPKALIRAALEVTA